jgi:outer membrane protein assembly factor BamB
MNNVKHHDGYLYGIGNYPNLYIYRHDGTTRTTVSGLLSSARKLIQSGDRLFALDDERRLYEISDDTAEQIGTESGFSETSGIVLNDVFIYAIKEVGFQSYLVYRWDGATWDSVPSFSLKEYRSSLISYWTKLALLNNSIVLHNIGVYGVLFYCESRDMFMPLGFPGQFYNDNIYPYDDTPIYTEGTSFMYSSGEKIMYFDNMGGNQIWNKSLPFEELL